MASVLVPETLTATDHGLEVYSSGSLVGGIAQWNWSQNARNTRARAFGPLRTAPGGTPALRGEPYENVPGNLQGVSIQFSRMELWSDQFGDAWGPQSGIPEGVLQLLNRSMILKSQIATPESGKSWRYVFYGCRFDTISQNHDPNGDRMVKLSGTISAQTMRIIAPRAGPFA